MAESPAYHGSLVAFEGPSDAISTQLRLLPTSPQIMILPGIQNYLANDDCEEGFEPAAYVRKVHDAVSTRSETALAFLRDSSPSCKRLVFMNGGAPSAQALCVSAISKYETDGDFDRAETIFNDVVRHGVAGLDTYGKDVRRNAFGYEEEQDVDENEDPITRAMRAADALDRQTASLQPSNDIDLTIATRPRSMSLPIYSYADHFGDAAHFYVFGAQEVDSDIEDYDEEAIGSTLPPMTPRLQISHWDGPDEELEYSDDEEMVFAPRSPSCVGEAYRPLSALSHLAADVFTPRSDHFSIQSFDPPTFGEASLVDLKSTHRKRSLRRTRSLDRGNLARRIFQDKLREVASNADFGEDGASATPRPQSCMHLPNDKGPLPRRISYIDGPKAVVVRPGKLRAVKLSPAPNGRKPKTARASYVDRGTDAADIPEPEPPFQPVLPLTEDLVIYFKDGAPDKTLDSVIKSFKDGTYPILSPPSTPKEEVKVAFIPGTPRSKHSTREPEIHEAEEKSTFQHTPPQEDSDEYDPYAYNPPAWNKDKKVLHIASQLRAPAPAPPTPAQTPPPPAESETEEKFHDFSILNCHTAVAVQNSLRSILNIYFPPEDKGYHQFHFPLLPELDGLWKPIFREAEPGSPRKDNRRIDLIFAVGAQRGVKKEYSSAITGQLEKLGTKPSGVSRSGRLDFRCVQARSCRVL
jgi:hypothetical protein